MSKRDGDRLSCFPRVLTMAEAGSPFFAPLPVRSRGIPSRCRCPKACLSAVLCSRIRFEVSIGKHVVQHEYVSCRGRRWTRFLENWSRYWTDSRRRTAFDGAIDRSLCSATVTPSVSNLAHTGNPHEAAREVVASLFENHYQGLCSFVLRYVGDRDAAEEIVQELFLRVWERLEAGAPIEQINAPYLYGGARNLAINLAVRQQAEKRWRQAAIHQLPQTSLAADAQSNLDDLATLIQRALDRLPQRSRLVFTLSRDRHMTYPEIARVLGVSVKGVEFHMGRALKALREAIE